MTKSSRSVRPHKTIREDNVHSQINLLNISYRVCCEFHLPKETKKKREVCGCGKHQNEHELVNTGSHILWDWQQHTVTRINPAHGQFLNKSWFIRLAYDTPFGKVEKILLEVWKIPKPQFIVSVIGGARFFKVNERIETNLINNIISVALKSNSWLLTNGLNTGIVHLVGQAMNKVRLTKPEAQLTAIGIAKWGSIRDVEKLTQTESGESEPTSTDPTKTFQHRVSKKKHISGQSYIERNHSHYLMVDDGTFFDYDLRDFRTRLAIHMARLQHEDDIVVPVVTLAVEGGADTLRNIYYDLKNKVPVVIVNGSGRISDFLSRWLLNTIDLENKLEAQKVVYEIQQLGMIKRGGSQPTGNPNDTVTIHVDAGDKKLYNLFDIGVLATLKQELINLLPADDELEINHNELTDQVLYCLQPAVRSDITIFELYTDTDLSGTIFRSICESRQKLSNRKTEGFMSGIASEQLQTSTKNSRNKRGKQAQVYIEKNQMADKSRLLDLAMKWDCLDVAKELIFQNSLNHILNKHQAFETAVISNLPSFVYEFLQLGIDPAELVFPENSFDRPSSRYKAFLRKLYTRDAVNDSNTHLSYFIEADKAGQKKTIASVTHLNLVLSTLVGDYMHPLYFDDNESEERYRKTHSLNKDEDNDHEQLNQLQQKRNKHIVCDYALRDLFLWSILMNHIDLAKAFLALMRYRICPALIASKILKQYHRKATYGVLKIGYLNNANYFEKYAIDCLDKCDDYDPEQACQIILQQNELYGFVTCMQVAADADDKEFITEQCCVEAMDNIWFDKLRSNQNKKLDKFLLFLGFITFGLAAPLCLLFREVEVMSTGERKKKALRSNGIDYCDPNQLGKHVPMVKGPLFADYLGKLIKFHTSVLTKYLYHLVFYGFFLLLFSYVLLFEFSPPTDRHPSIHWTEILTIIFVSCMLIEEIQYLLSQDSLTWIGKTQKYFGSFFKQMTTVGFLLFYIGLIVRFTTGSSEQNFVAARIIMAIDLEIWWLRSLAFITVSKHLGPNLVAIGKMLKDLLFFLCIIAIVMTGYGVASRSMVYYPVVNNFTTETGGSIDTSFDGRSVFRQIIYPVYYFLYGNIDDELTNLDTNPNAAWAIATQVLLAAHMIFVNILLLNLLIAIFSKRFSQVYDEIQKIWYYQQYLFVREYYTRSPFLPPISLLYDTYYLIERFICFITKRHHNARVFKIIPEDPLTVREWYHFEDATTVEYAQMAVKSSINNSEKSEDERISSKQKKTDSTALTNTDVERVEEKFSHLNEMIEHMKKYLDSRSAL